MEHEPGNIEMKAEAKPEWKKPQVTEFDVNSITLSATSGTGEDLVFYS